MAILQYYYPDDYTDNPSYSISEDLAEEFSSAFPADKYSLNYYTIVPPRAHKLISYPTGTVNIGADVLDRFKFYVLPLDLIKLAYQIYNDSRSPPLIKKSKK